MAPTVTKNGSSLQIILPKHICESKGICPGDRLDVDSTENGIILSRKDRDGDNGFYTIGYEGKNIDSFIDILKNKGVEQIIDVRAIAFSRKKGFSKRSLEERLTSEGMGYIHLPRLGSPKDIRYDYKSGGSPDSFFEEYSKYVDTQENEMAMLLWYVKKRRSALMCFEQLYTQCHRKVLAERLEEMNMTCVHLP